MLLFLFKKKIGLIFYLNDKSVAVVDVVKLVEIVEINFLMLFVDCESILLLKVVDVN